MSTHLTRGSFATIVVLASATLSPSLVCAASTVVAQTGDASIAHDTSAGTWTLTAGGATLTLALDASRDFALQSLMSPSGVSWSLASTSDSVVNVGTQTLAFGSRTAGFVYAGAIVDQAPQRLQLTAIFDLPTGGVRVARHYAIVSGSPSFEAWNSYVPIGPSVSLGNLNALQITVPAGTIRSLAGLQGDSADVINDAAFTLNQTTLAVGQQFAIGATYRASEQNVPWFAVDGAKDEFYAALMWSGAWSLTVSRTSTGLAVTYGLATMTTTATTSVDGPHAIFGVAAGGLPEASAAIRSYVVQGLRGGRSLTPMVTYNTWFAYGTAVDEQSMRGEMSYAASLGADLFVLDAGWYAGAGAAGVMDFTTGLGAWTPDPARFPNGLKPLTDYAHSLGMQFGLWVEPERTDRSLVGNGGLDEQWLATTGGQYGSGQAGQICLANAVARQWLMDGLTSLLDATQPDYLKWDNNSFINCDRDGHGHGATDGNFAHVNGLYTMLAALRERYPNMAIENVSGGGNRLDIGMLRYSDVAWMDDRSTPSAHVRHNVQGLSVLFPPAYLLSFVVDGESEPLHDSPDLPLYFRSRMQGVLGLCFRIESFSYSEQGEMAQHIAAYKALWAAMGNASAGLLTQQAAPQDGPAWDVLQESAISNGQLVVSAVQTDQGVTTFIVKPSGLQPGVTYDVTSVDAGALGSATGASLMSDGISVTRSPASAAHILILTARQQ
jgi:alpha-galactosidase